MSDINSKSFMGRGWKFPVQIDPKTGKIAMSEHEDDIREALNILLRTQVGERVMHPGFGSRLKEYVFENNDRALLNSMQRDILDLITLQEPRVRDVSVEASMDKKSPAVAIVEIRYTVRSTNNMFNMVYPFYLMEGA